MVSDFCERSSAPTPRLMSYLIRQKWNSTNACARFCSGIPAEWLPMVKNSGRGQFFTSSLRSVL